MANPFCAGLRNTMIKILQRGKLQLNETGENLSNFTNF